MDRTLYYYNTNAREYVNSTLHIDMTEIQNLFLGKMKPFGKILDFGCGSGRDALAFINKGYSVDAVDASHEICRLASEILPVPVRQMYFSDLKATDKYDGIWACASLLHLDVSEMKEVMFNGRNIMPNSPEDLTKVVNFLNGKADVDLTNCTKPHIVETYKNGTSWYRVYSDGWCEQGGKYTVTASYGYYTINLLKSYLNTEYNIQLTAGLTSYDRSILYSIPSVTSSSFQMYFSGSASDTHTGDWQTCGYIS
jgi:SAM-dependent methyltransferase